MIGKTISHYQILEKLGEGGMGQFHSGQIQNILHFKGNKIIELLKQ